MARLPSSSPASPTSMHGTHHDIMVCEVTAVDITITATHKCAHIHCHFGSSSKLSLERSSKNANMLMCWIRENCIRLWGWIVYELGYTGCEGCNLLIHVDSHSYPECSRAENLTRFAACDVSLVCGILKICRKRGHTTIWLPSRREQDRTDPCWMWQTAGHH